MKVSVVQVCNTKDIRLNKMLLEKYQIEDKVELVLESEYILIKPVRQPRQGWDDAFAEMRKNEDDQLLIDPVFDDETPDE